MSRLHPMTSQPKQIGNKNQKVKIYYLTRQEQWIDLGVGSLYQIREFNPQTEEQEDYIQVQAVNTEEIAFNLDIEEDELKRLNRDVEYKIIIRFRFHPDNYYEKQNDSIIICKEKSSTLEFAISFTDAEQTNEFWEYIKKNNGTNLNEMQTSMNADQFDDLQMPHLSKLDETLEAIDMDLSHFCQGIVYKPEFLEKLFETFDELEVVGEVDKLQQIHLIVKKFNKRGGPKENYRELQKNESKFKQIIEIKNSEILEKIHMNYRLQYIKDSVIASYIEESTINTFNIIITRNNMEILEYIKDRQFISELSEKFFDNLGDSIKFIGELLAIINNPNFTLSFKPQIVEIMNSYNFFKVFFQALKIIQDTEKDKDLRTKQSLKLMEAITILANENKKELISILFTGEKTTTSQHSNRYNQINSSAQKEGTSIEMRKQNLALLSQLLIQEDTGLQIQVVEVFKVIFESMKSSSNSSNNDIDEKIVSLLMNDFFSYCFDCYSKMEINNQFINFVIQFLDLFQLAYKLSPSKFLFYIQKNQLIVKLFQRTDCRDKAVHLALVKLVRSLIVTDNIIINHMINYKIIDKIWEIYKRYERRSNLVNSTFQDMLQYLLVQNVYQTPKLFKYIMNNFGEELKARQGKILCFKKIVETYGKQKDWINQDRNEHLDFSNSDYLQQPHALMESIEEEKYFESDDRQSEENVAPVLDQKQQLEKEKDTMIRRQSLKEKVLKNLSKDDDEYDIFSLVQTQKSGALNTNLNEQSNQGDSVSSSSSLINNMNLININGDSHNPSDSSPKDKQNKIEISIDLGSAFENENDEDSSSNSNILMEIEEKNIDNSDIKKDEEVKDQACNESLVSNTSYANKETKSINSKRSIREREEIDFENSFIDENLHGNGEEKEEKTETKNTSDNESDNKENENDNKENENQIENKPEQNHSISSPLTTTNNENHNIIYKHHSDEEEQEQEKEEEEENNSQNIVKSPSGEELIQKKIKVD